MAMGIPPATSPNDDRSNGTGRLEQRRRQYTQHKSDERVRSKREQGCDAILAELQTKALADQPDGDQQYVYAQDDDKPANLL